MKLRAFALVTSLLALSACAADEGDATHEPPPHLGTVELRLGAQALTSHDFGEVVVAQSSDALALTVVNTSLTVTGVLRVRVEGPDAASFDASDVHTDCDDGIVLAPDATCSVRVRFRPSTAGMRAANLVVTATPGGTTTLALTGTALAVPPPPAGPCEVAGTTITGDVRIRSSADLPALAGVGEITGDLVIDAPGVQAIALPDLVVVGRDVLVQPTSRLLADLRLPALCRVGRTLRVDRTAALATLDLGALRRVEQGLEIIGTAVASLPMAQLVSVGGDLRLERNRRLTAVGASAALRRVGGALRVIDADALASLAGLDGLTALGGLELRNVPALPSLAGLGAAPELTLLHVEGNGALVSISALRGVRAVRGPLRIVGNPALTSLAGLDDLATAGTTEIRDNAGLVDAAALARVELLGSLEVKNNDALASLPLSSLAAIDGAVTIEGNDALADLRLELLTALGQSSRISGNPRLPVCSAERVRNRVRLNGFNQNFQIQDNALCRLGPGRLEVAGGNAAETPLGVAAFPDGSFITAGTLEIWTDEGTITFGAGQPTETTLYMFGKENVVARFNADGTFAWARILESSLAMIDVAALPDGSSALLVGTTVWRLSPTGDILALYSAPVQSSAIAVAPDGGYVVASRPMCPDSVVCQNGLLTAYDAGGVQRWQVQMLRSSVAGFTPPTGVARLADGTVLVSGMLNGTAVFGAGTPAQRTISGNLGYVARYSTAGVFLGVETVTNLVPRIVGGGDVAALCGTTRTTAVFSDGARPARTVPAWRLVVARYGAGGGLDWLRTARRGGSEEEVECRPGVTSRGVLAAMQTCSTTVFEEGTMDETHATPVIGCDPTAVRFGADGSFGGVAVLDTQATPSSRVVAAALTEDGRGLLFGAARTSIRFGPFTVPLPVPDGEGFFLSRIDPI